ncbi:hypothetical protein F5884DRAFT_61978 [Xylogone sp. PMI_703]|nr:hypothetical protein F5884DRAFT_61978 [Xylogone sp. PMI_703]
MHLILTGATGLVGSGVLHSMITNSNVTKVSVLSRRPVAQAEGHSKVQVIIHKDFTKYEPTLLEELKGAEGCVWALGISSTQVGKEEYEAITYTYAVEAAKAFATIPPSPSRPFKFVYVSGEGATPEPTRTTAFFGVVKGRAEAALLALSKEHPTAFAAYSARLGMPDPVAHEEIKEFLPKRSGMIGIVEKVAGPVIRNLAKGMTMPTREGGAALVKLAMGDGKPLEGPGISGEGRTMNNSALRRLAGL